MKRPVEMVSPIGSVPSLVKSNTVDSVQESKPVTSCQSEEDNESLGDHFYQ